MEATELMDTVVQVFIIRSSIDTRLTLVAFVGMQAVYWLVTHPVNDFWLRDQELTAPAAVFFSFGTKRRDGFPAEWTVLRDRWEYSHVARAVLACIALLALALAT